MTFLSFSVAGEYTLRNMTLACPMDVCEYSILKLGAFILLKINEFVFSK